jgi:hypothetical protein
MQIAFIVGNAPGYARILEAMIRNLLIDKQPMLEANGGILTTKYTKYTNIILSANLR